MRPRFTPVLFDLDGTLVDSAKDIAAAANRTMLRLGLAPMPEEEIISFVGDGIRRLMELVLAQRSAAEVDAAVRDFRADYRESCLVHTRPYPGIVELLGELRGHPLGVVTNKPRDFAQIILEGLGLSGFFGAIVGGDEAGLKPSAEPLLLACRRLGLEPGPGLIIGDHLNDIEAGKQAGMYTCAVFWGLDRGATVRSAGADFECAAVSDLHRAIFQPGAT